MNNAQEQKLLKAFGKQVAQVRKSRGITQQELAEKVGMSVVAIAYIETGKRWAKASSLYVSTLLALTVWNMLAIWHQIGI